MKTTAANSHHRVGAHCSTQGGHDKAIHLAKEVGCEVVQVFTKNNMQWAAKPLAPEAVAAYEVAKAETGITEVFAHAGYLINLAGNRADNHAKSRASLQDELVRCRQLALPFMVMHPGAHLGEGREVGLKRIVKALDDILGDDDGATRIALEITAGGGSLLGGQVEDLAWLLDHAKHRERLAVCLDTCHLFAAGYDLRSAAAIDDFIGVFSKLIPWEEVVCVHLNDSKGPLGGHKDRHELLGAGELGWTCFETIVRHPAFAAIPLCLETPKGDDNANDSETLERLKAARAGEAVAPYPPAADRMKRAAAKKTAKKVARKAMKKTARRATKKASTRKTPAKKTRKR